MPTSSQRFVAIDWSGAHSVAEQRRRIVAADWQDGEVTLLAGRTRDETAAWLIAQARRTPAMVAGLDFSFSFPSWFVQECGAETIEDFWRIAAENAERWLSDCEAPFWGRPGKGCPANHRAPFWRGYRVCERPENISGHPSSTFQIGGAGAVGTGSLRGMRTLIELRDGGFSIWPFHTPGLPCVMEIYPRLFTGPVLKSDAAARAAYFTRHLSAQVSPGAIEAASSSQDAFDALCSVIGMARQSQEIAQLERAKSATALLEGAIFPGRSIASK